MRKNSVFDVFVSYRSKDPDKAWVQGRLIPTLQADGLAVCIDYLSFRLGAPLVLEMERAVESSRYTLAVVTPSYLDSTFTTFENVLAEHLGLLIAQRRLLVALREHADTPLRMQARLWLDMTDDATFDATATRLCGELRRRPDG